MRPMGTKFRASLSLVFQLQQPTDVRNGKTHRKAIILVANPVPLTQRVGSTLQAVLITILLQSAVPAAAYLDKLTSRLMLLI